MQARDQAFRELKPVCVRLSESSLKLMGSSGSLKTVTDNLSQLLQVLEGVQAQKHALDSKIGDYVFFPLSNVLRKLETLPLKARELTFECILIILESAWSRTLSPDLGMQLLILYSFLGDQKPPKTSEELEDTVFRSMELVFRALGSTVGGREALVKVDAIPHIGKCLSVTLDAALDGSSERVRLSSILALDAFCQANTDRDAMGISFLPGIMSCLTKVLTPRASRTSAKVLVAAIHVLQTLLPSLFNDLLVKSLSEGTSEPSRALNQSWLHASSSQIRMALANIFKVQKSDRQDVRLALWKLCSSLLLNCALAFKESIAMLLEVAVTLANREDTIHAELRSMLAFNDHFVESLRSSLRHWIISLPRLMDTTEDSRKQAKLQQISLSISILAEQGVDMSMIYADLTTNLRDTIMMGIKDANGLKVLASVQSTSISLNVARVGSDPVVSFEETLVSSNLKPNTITELQNLAEWLGSNETALIAARDLAGTLPHQTGDQQVASFWLSLNILRHAFQSASSADAFLSFTDEITDQKLELLEQLYEFSVMVLSEPALATNRDWRIHALALETLALQAIQLKEDFRIELIDTLYPVLSSMGAPVPELQHHAITCLNVIARECGYSDTGELVVANVDYLVNAVALRLSTFDISPQAPQVLLMMVKLSGPSLLPYLDDTVESVFVALESFHGYSKLVDLLFSVLNIIVQVGSKTAQLSISSGGQMKHRKERKRLTSVNAIAEFIGSLQRRHMKSNDEEVVRDQTPGESCGTATEKLDQPTNNEQDASLGEPNTESDQPPASRTYALMLKISQLTQHYLTSSSPELRTSLLDLLSSAIPALAKHENSFLPLINTLWPVLLPRLKDSEPYVISGSLNIIGVMCTYAGDFMSGRVEEAWPEIKRLYKTKTSRVSGLSAHLQRDATHRVSITDTVTHIAPNDAHVTVQPHYVDAPSRIIWEALVETLVSILNFTAINDMMYDEILEVLTPVIRSRIEVREALESRNADAVWFALWRLDSRSDGPSPLMKHGLPHLSQPGQNSSWQFASLS